MATGSYGIKRSATVSVDDIEVFLNFTPNRETLNSNVVELNSQSVLSAVKEPSGISILGGLYNLRLPTNVFTTKGFYNIIIRPKTIVTKITDCGVLSSSPSVKGIILDSGNPSVAQFQSKFTNGGLVGYRIEYIDPITNQKIPNLFRVVTSANRCEPVTENLTNTNQKAVRYRFNDTGSLVFLTVTPSSAPSVRPNATPFLGDVNGTIHITNTFFDPIMIEIEMVEQTIETLSYGIYGNQTISIQDGKQTIYDNNNNIYKQYNLFDINDDLGQPLFEVKQETSNIDTTKDFNTIINTTQQ